MSSAQIPKREIRAVWLTTNYDLDWPTKPFKTIEDICKQKENLLNILYCLKEANFNMIFFQTRLRGDVLYHSKIEFMSSFVKHVYSEEMYDPLAFVIKECHKLGLECHVWLVTYNLGPVKNRQKSYCSLTVKQNKLPIKKYNGTIYLDPGDPMTNKYLLSIVKEILEKYDIDGIHMDYIRYPEHSENFPDSDTYKQYGGKENKIEWRKNNINKFVTELYDMVKNKKKWVQVSSAVAGVYTKLSCTNKKYWTAYEVFQDPDQWLRLGKHDFIVPMMYYSNDLFFTFIQDWQTRNYGRLIVPGLGIYRLDEKKSNWTLHTITEQIEYSRQCHVGGNVFFRTEHLIKNKKGIMDVIKNNFYTYPALLPSLVWLKKTPPDPPKHLQLTVLDNFILLNWESVKCFKKEVMFYNIYRLKNRGADINDASNLIASRVETHTFSIPIKDSSHLKGCYYAITSYDRYHNESKMSKLVYFQSDF